MDWSIVGWLSVESPISGGPVVPQQQLSVSVRTSHQWLDLLSEVSISVVKMHLRYG